MVLGHDINYLALSGVLSVRDTPIHWHLVKTEE